MTLEELAVAADASSRAHGLTELKERMEFWWFREAVEARISAAVAAEREQIAKWIEGTLGGSLGRNCAAGIRNRASLTEEKKP